MVRGKRNYADIAIAGGRNEGLLIRKGQIIEKLDQSEMVDRLKEEIQKYTEQ